MTRSTRLSGLLAFAFAAALAGCGNGAPSVTTFTLTVTGKDATGNTTLDGKVSVTDPDGDRITKVDISGSGPAAIPSQSIAIPAGVTVTDLPIKLVLSAAAPKGDYTFSLIAYDEPGAPSTAATAKIAIP